MVNVQLMSSNEDSPCVSHFTFSLPVFVFFPGGFCAHLCFICLCFSFHSLVDSSLPPSRVLCDPAFVSSGFVVCFVFLVFFFSFLQSGCVVSFFIACISFFWTPAFLSLIQNFLTRSELVVKKWIIETHCRLHYSYNNLIILSRDQQILTNTDI